MSTCGYVCPVCEGKGYTDEGKKCNYCNLAYEMTSENEQQHDIATEKI
jgi:hypothetical protein